MVLCMSSRRVCDALLSKVRLRIADDWVRTYTITLAQQHNFEKLSELPQVYGYIAFAAFNLMFISALQFIRKRFYEAFWMLHVVLFVVAMVFMGLHKPLKYQWAAVGVAAIYALDRVIRTIRRIYYSWGNSATLIPLPGLATKIVFKRYIGCTPGSHAFVTIPAISVWQSHPFTISSVDGVEFVVKAQQNFTLDLHKVALKNPGIQVRAWIDGPYGAVPDFKNKDHVVLFAGGSGGAFLFPVALDIARNAGRCRARRVEAIWAVRDESKYPMIQLLPSRRLTK
jgi:predicted ferric reductase